MLIGGIINSYRINTAANPYSDLITHYTFESHVLDVVGTNVGVQPGRQYIVDGLVDRVDTGGVYGNGR